MKRRHTYRLASGLGVAAGAAAIAVACSSSTSLHHAASCPTYSGGAATTATLAGTYALVSFCEDTQPALGPLQGVTGSLVMTHTTTDSFQATINIPRQSPVMLAGPYMLSHDTISVSLPPPFGTFAGTYNFAANTLYVSGHLPGSPPPPIAIVFFR
jgi:hypothetical protein